MNPKTGDCLYIEENEDIYRHIKSLEAENKKYKEAIDKAVDIAWKYAQIDGSHHRIWVIDQMLRTLLDSDYENFVKEYVNDGEYEWDIGIAP